MSFPSVNGTMIRCRDCLSSIKRRTRFLIRFLSNSTGKEETDIHLTAGYLTRMLGSNQKQWETILSKYKQLHSVKREDLVNSAKLLKSLNYTIEEIQRTPSLLHYNALTLKNRHSVLLECGCQSIGLILLNKFLTVIGRDIVQLKSRGIIPYNLDVESRLAGQFTDVDLQLPIKYDETIKLKILRESILNVYLTQRLGLNEEQLTKIWKIYSRIRHKSFQSIQRMVDILMNDLHFSRERIIKNPYLLYGEPDNVKRMLKLIKSIDGQDFRVILHKLPKIIMSHTDNLVKTIDHIKSFGIDESALLKCLELLTLSSDTVLERLRDLQHIEEFQVLLTNPRVLRLVHYQNKARLRLEYLNQLKVRCASLHVLSCGSEAFSRFAREGTDRTKGRDIVVYLATMLKSDLKTIRSVITRHKNWCHVPLTQVKHCYDYLRKQGFSESDIFFNLYILLYSVKLIEEKLEYLDNEDSAEKLNIDKPMVEIAKSRKLTLVLYLIEKEFHFTGDGIWKDHQHIHVENFHNILPDFPESVKVHRYGFKERKNKGTQQSAAL